MVFLKASVLVMAEDKKVKMKNQKSRGGRQDGMEQGGRRGRGRGIENDRERWREMEKEREGEREEREG